MKKFLNNETKLGELVEALIGVVALGLFGITFAIVVLSS